MTDFSKAEDEAIYGYKVLLAKLEFYWSRFWDNFFVFKIRFHFPQWTHDLACTLFWYGSRLATIVGALLLMGAFAYETSFLCFNMLGYVPPAQRRLFRKKDVDTDKEIAELPPHERAEAEGHFLRKKRVNEEIFRGGHWLWWWEIAFWFAYMKGADGFPADDPLGFFKKAGLASLSTLLVFNVFPIFATFVVRMIVPAAYTGTPWLCEREELVGEGLDLAVKEVTKAVNSDGEPVVQKKKTYRPAEVTQEDYEEKRAGYRRRADRAKARGGLPTRDELKMME